MPAGFSPATETAPIGVPVGLEILGWKWDEAKILGIAWQIEKLTKIRRAPAWAMEVVEVSGKAVDDTTVPEVTPDTSNISQEYPIGTLGGAVVG